MVVARERLGMYTLTLTPINITMRFDPVECDWTSPTLPNPMRQSE